MTKDASPDPLVGQVLMGKLEVVRTLGEGGMGSVYEVEHLITHHRRALKIIKPELVKRRTYMKRLIREAGVAGTLQTPYVVDTLDAGTLDDGSVYILMELLDGQTLLDVIKREVEIPVPRLIGIMAQVCEGVAVAHRAGIIHRDLKPDNVFLLKGPTGADRVKIMDFGISQFDDPEDGPSRLTSEGVVLGTPFYMSPEQARGKELDPRTDVYSVGVMLYEGLTGTLPFDDQSISALFIKIAVGEYVPVRHLRPDVPEGLAEVVHRAMHRKRDKRFGTMDALREALLPYGTVDDKVRAKTLSDHPAPLRSTTAYEDRPSSPGPPAPVSRGGTLATGAAGRDPELHKATVVDQEPLAAGDVPRSVPPSEAGVDDRSATSVHERSRKLRRPSSRPPAATTERIDRSQSVRPEKRSHAAAIVGVAAVLAVAVGVGVALSGGDDPPELEVLDPVIEGEEAAERDDPEPPADPSAEEREGAEEAPVAAEETEPAAGTTNAPETADDEPNEAGQAVEGDDTPPSRMGRRRRATPAEEAGLELSPY